MIRYVFIGDQIDEDENGVFAFYDTVRDEFMSFDDVEVFTSLADFVFYASTCENFERCLGLIPVESVDAI